MPADPTPSSGDTGAQAGSRRRATIGRVEIDFDALVPVSGVSDWPMAFLDGHGDRDYFAADVVFLDADGVELVLPRPSDSTTHFRVS